MADRLIFAAVLFLIGDLAMQHQAELPAGWLLVVLAIAGLGLLRLRHGWLPAALLLGFAWAGGHAHLSAPAELPSDLIGQDIIVTARVDGIPERQGDRWRFPLLVEQIRFQDQFHTGRWRMRISWYDAEGVPKAAETWQFKLKARAATGLGNPGGFDYVGWLYRQGIRYTGYVRRDSGNQRIRVAPKLSLLAWRQRLAESLSLNGLSGHATALLRALVVGDRSRLSRNDWDLLAATGTSHLMAISGLHIGLVASIGWWLGSVVWRRIPGLTQRWPARFGGAWLALVFGVGYAALAGFALPTQRALLMLILVIGALLLRRSVVPARTLALAMLAVLLWDPPAVLDIGFWLSFSAVAAILYILVGRLGRIGKVMGAIRIQWVLLPVLAPLIWLHFQRLSLVAPLINLVLVPLFSVIVVPVALLGTLLLQIWPAGGEWVLVALGWPLAWLWQGLDWSAALPWAQIQGPAPALWAVLLAGLGAIWLTAPGGIPGRWLAPLLALPLFFPRPDRPEPGDFRLTLLDVGQGLSLVVETSEHLLVYDTGPKHRSGFDTGKDVVAPYLQRQGYRSIERLIVSHGDNDHAGGLLGLAGKLRPEQIWSGEPGELPLPAQACRDGQAWQWDGVEFQILHPEPGAEYDGNDLSCVLKVSNPAGSFLVGADIEAPAEQRLLRDHAHELKTDILLIPHHGSRSSSTPEFVAATDPDWLLVQVGANNRYGFPMPDIIQR